MSTARWDRAGRFAFAAAALSWILVLGQILRHSIYVSHDTIINYAHVWYASDRLWGGHGLPTRMPGLGHGEAFAFPYGFLPWSIAALARPALGDWTVTLLLVIVTLGLFAATFWSFPELRKGWWAAAILVEPAVVSAPLIGQIPFMTGSVFLMLAVGAWLRGYCKSAVAAAAMAQATHPAIVLPLTLALVVGWLAWEPNRRRLLVHYACSLVIAMPALWMTLHAPVMNEASTGTKAFGFIATIAPRSLVLLVPLVLLAIHHYWRSDRAGPTVVGGLLLANASFWIPLGMPWAWKALSRQPDTRMVEFTESDEFVAGATYRVLRVGDGKIGMYQLLQKGGRLDSEFFPESILRRSWSSPEEYVDFLARRKVDFVMIWRGYDRRFHTNEHALVEQLATNGTCTDDTRVRRIEQTDDYDLFRIARPCSSQT